jgi:predicted DNA-binding protein
MKKKDEVDDKRIALRMSVDMHEKLLRISRKRAIPVSILIRHWITLKIEEEFPLTKDFLDRKAKD